MRKLLVSVLMISLLALLVGGATMAYFTDSESVAGNYFTTGTVDVATGGSLPFEVTGMAPGDSVTDYLIVKNDGDLDMLFRVWASWVNDAEFAKQFTVDVVLNPTGEGPGIPDGYTQYGSDGADTFDSKTIYQLTNANNAYNNHDAYFTDGWPMPPGYAAVYKITVTLNKNAGNEWAGRTFRATMKVDATQAANQTDGSVVY